MRRSQRRTPQPPRLTGDNSAVAFHQTRLGELAGSIIVVDERVLLLFKHPARRNCPGDQMCGGTPAYAPPALACDGRRASCARSAFVIWVERSSKYGRAQLSSSNFHVRATSNEAELQHLQRVLAAQIGLFDGFLAYVLCFVIVMSLVLF